MRVLLIALALWPSIMMGEEKFTKNQFLVACLRHKTEIQNKLGRMHSSYSFSYMHTALSQISCFKMVDTVVGNNDKKGEKK